MKQNQVQPTPPAPLTTPIQSDSPRRGRPTIRTAQVVHTICSFIQKEGISDSAAGYFAGVSSTTLSRWKQEDEDFELALGKARGEFEMNCLRVIQNSMNRNGTPNWRASAWLLQNCSADGYRPARKSRRSGSQPSGGSRESIEETDDGRLLITFEELEDVIQYRIQQALQSAQLPNSNGATLPEIPENQNTGILPEIHPTAAEASSPSRSSRLGVNPLPSSADHALPKIQDGAILPEIRSASAETPVASRLSRRERRFHERQLAKARKAAASASTATTA